VALVNVLTPSTAGQAGLSRSALYRGARAGRLDRIARGIYLPAEASGVDWDLLEAATRRPDATICLISALAHYDLTDAIPAALDVAIPRGVKDTGEHRCDRMASIRPGHIRTRTRREDDPGIEPDDRDLLA
jgi:Transcriptional regulator, AbiEi antitoxin